MRIKNLTYLYIIAGFYSLCMDFLRKRGEKEEFSGEMVVKLVNVEDLGSRRPEVGGYLNASPLRITAISSPRTTKITAPLIPV